MCSKLEARDTNRSQSPLICTTIPSQLIKIKRHFTLRLPVVENRLPIWRMLVGSSALAGDIECLAQRSDSTAESAERWPYREDV